MTPNASSVIAQVNVGLLIALAIEAKTTETGSKDGHAHEMTGERGKEGRAVSVKDRAWLQLLSLMSLFVSLGITLASVVYNKPVSGVALHIAVDAIGLGALPLIGAAIDRLMPQIKTLRNTLFLLAIMLAAVIWFIVWSIHYVPGGFY